MERLTVVGCYAFWVALACVLFVAALGFLTVQLVKGLIHG